MVGDGRGEEEGQMGNGRECKEPKSTLDPLN